MVHIINQSIDVEDPVLGAVLAHVYGRAGSLTIRGHLSMARLERFGVPTDGVVTAPDTAWLTEASVSPPPEPAVAALPAPRVGLSLTSFGLDGPGVVRRAVEAIQAAGASVVMLSNDPFWDVQNQDAVRDLEGVATVEAAHSYRDYTALLGTLDAVISSRTHTAVMALVVGTPVIPIGADKTLEAMVEVGYEMEFLDTADGDWTSRLGSLLGEILADPVSAREDAEKAAAQGRERAPQQVRCLSGDTPAS